MTRRKSLQTIHEPFGDAFYYGPERLSSRYENDRAAIEASGFEDSSYRSVLENIQAKATKVCRSTFAPFQINDPSSALVLIQGSATLTSPVHRPKS